VRSYVIEAADRGDKCDSCHEAEAILELVIGSIDDSTSEMLCGECVQGHLKEVEEDLEEARRGS